MTQFLKTLNALSLRKVLVVVTGIVLVVLILALAKANICIQSTCFFPMPPSPEQLIPNGSFEETTSGWADSWQSIGTGASIDTHSQGNAGTNSLHLVAGAAKTQVVSVPFKVSADTTYSWAFFLKTVGDKGVVGFVVDEYDGNGGYVNTVYLNDVQGLVKGQEVYPYKPSSGAVVTAKLQYYMDPLVAPKTTFEAFIDDVQLAS